MCPVCHMIDPKIDVNGFGITAKDHLGVTVNYIKDNLEPNLDYIKPFFDYCVSTSFSQP